MSLIINDDTSFLFSDKLEQISGVKHFFSTKICEDYGNTINNINNHEGVLNKIMMDAGFVSSKIVYLKQVHGDRLHYVDESNCNEIIGLEGDAIVTSTKNIAIGIFTADCVPILIVDRRLGIIAAIHAGWKGTRLRIVEKVVAFMTEELGANTEELIVGIGPSIGVCCFEVSEEVYELFTFKTKVDNSFYVDLNKENISQLTECGVLAQNIDGDNLCTMCNEGLFHSFRREKGHAGRQASYIQLV